MAYLTPDRFPAIILRQRSEFGCRRKDHRLPVVLYPRVCPPPVDGRTYA